MNKDRPGRWWGSVIPALTLLAGMLFAASASTARGTDLRGGSRTQITEHIAAEQQRFQRDQREYARLRSEVDRLSEAVGARDERVKVARNRAKALEGPAAFAPASGRGLKVEMNDAPYGSAARLPYKPNPDDLVVHQQDVVAVVNALWAGGATAMQIMNQRVIATSAVRCVGNTLILQGVVHSPSFRIIAIGDPERMRRALDDAPDVRLFQRSVDAYGLGYSVKTLNSIKMPAYDGSVALDYARAAGP